nr:MAG TPA: hypothetical protein [Caudoviricetes sp.]
MIQIRYLLCHHGYIVSIPTLSQQNCIPVGSPHPLYN